MVPKPANTPDSAISHGAPSAGKSTPIVITTAMPLSACQTMSAACRRDQVS